MYERIIIDSFQYLHHLTKGKVQLLYDELNKYIYFIRIEVCIILLKHLQTGIRKTKYFKKYFLGFWMTPYRLQNIYLWLGLLLLNVRNEI